MGSYSQLTYHIVYSTKFRYPSILPELRERLYEYIGGIIRAKNGCVEEIGGVADHIHILARLSATIAIADMIRDIKANSSRWINEQPETTRPFEWQKGYGAFTVSYDRIPNVSGYIQKQEEHHKSVSFQDEYIDFLKRHGIEYRLEYLFENEHHG